METYTSAGRLLTQLERLRDRFRQGSTVAACICDVFELPYGGWPRGLYLYYILLDRVKADIGCLSVNRQMKYEETWMRLRMAVDPQIFAQPAAQVGNGHFTDVDFERIEAADETLRSIGRSQAIDKNGVQSSINALKAVMEDIQAGESSEIDNFIIDKIRELIFSLENYQLYGPEGVRFAVESLVGAIALTALPGIALSDRAISRAKGLMGVTKVVLDVVVYAQASVEALQWSGQNLAALMPPFS